jgi:hypothetical protein
MKKVVYINAPVQNVFKAVYDAELQKKWLDFIVNVDYNNGIASGKTFNISFKNGNNKDGIVTYTSIIKEYKENQVFHVMADGATMSAEIKYTLEAVDGKTKLTYENNTKAKTLPLKIMLALTSWWMPSLMMNKYFKKLEEVAKGQ